ncbi:acetylcholinesterase-like [Amphibalanus amphitrite]|uniref:acetylcholinesterase-like n=1 Tax=Amphibalanus amphitrite TaxID=1232801 RepID=UPI001C911E1E|nr:acetylcholinesterase-like [Amphibalanus amphitrite]
MTCEGTRLLFKRTGKRKRAKKLVMDTGQLRPGDRCRDRDPAARVQSDCVTARGTICGVQGAAEAARAREKDCLVWTQPVRRGAVRTAVQLCRVVTVFGLLVVILPGVTGQGRTAPIITIRQGSLEGVREYVDPRQRPVFSYKGIPYATPPVGSLRFKPPVRDYGWNRTQRFDRFGPECPQLDVQGVPEPGVSEDCLTLNVWIPQVPDGFQRFPVVVFLNGELFWRQRASRYPLEELSSEDIVTVSVSYRTNLFGFFTLQSSAAPGNLGLRDQQLALLWVRENIGAFGGDPRRVTLVGFSAGAASVGLHLVSPQSQGLFQRAMLVSGSPLATWAHMEAGEARRIGQEVTAIMGCRSGSDWEAVRCLQDQDFMRLLTAAQRILESRGRFHPVFAPVTDSFVVSRDQFLPEDPDRLLKRGDFVKVPVMSGVDADDGVLLLYQYPGTDRLTFSNLTEVLRRVVIPRLMDQQGLTRRRALLTGVLSYRYVDTVPPGSQQQMLTSFVKIFSDAYFVAPLYSFLDLYARSGADLYAYGYNGEGPDIFGNIVSLPSASHGSELLYVLGPSMYRDLVGGTYGAVQQRLGQKLRTYWKGFITDGDPVRGRYGERWDRYTLDQPVFQDLVHSVSVVGYRREDASYWNKFLSFIAAENTGPSPTEGVTTEPLVGSGPQYETATWVLLAVLLLLIVGLLVAFLLTRRRRRLKSDMAYG